MERRGMVVAMLVTMALIFAWTPLTNWFAEQMGWDVAPRQIEHAASTQPAGAPATAPTITAAQPGTAATTTVAQVSQAGGLRLAPATQPAVGVVLGSAEAKDPNYRMAVAIEPEGAGIVSVSLNEFKRSARDQQNPYIFQQPYPSATIASRPFATRKVIINGQEIDLTDAQWVLRGRDEHSATYTVTINDGDTPMARVVKTYQLTAPEDPSRGYEIIITHAFENLTDRPLSLKASFNGPNVPPRESDRGAERYTIGGYQYRNRLHVQHDLVEAYNRENAVKDYIRDADGNPILWAGTASNYFQSIARPLPIDGTNNAPQYIERVAFQSLNPDASAENHDVMSTFTTTELSVAANGSVQLPMRAFFGPRQRRLLNEDYYAAFPLSYDQTLVLTAGPCGICTFQWLINILVGLLRWFFVVTRDWGLAIIGLVVLVRAILHPITKKSQIAMAKMSKMGPEMERLKKKHGDNKEELTKAMWELQKEQGVGAYLGCLPMFLQMPIWIALWQSLQTTFELRQAPFLYGWTWIDDLSKPDHLIEFAQPVQIFFLHISGLNILPILLGVVFWLQMKFQPKPATMTKEQEQQQKMMMWMMPLLFPLMLYSGPSGLNLYILTSTAIGIIESKIVRDHIRQKEEAEKAGRIIIDARPTRAAKQGRVTPAAAIEPQKPAGCVGGWFANLQQYAEQVQREAQKKRK